VRRLRHQHAVRRQPRGLSGADDKCQARTVAASLSGTYRAWLSTSASSPATDSTFTKASGPYRLVNGTQIAADWDDLIDGTPLAVPINVTESGGSSGNHFVWTHTRPDGTAGGVSNADCGGWMSNDGSADGDAGNTVVTSRWTVSTSAACSYSEALLYCFQQS
jgi:hypothetical protein